MRSLSMDETIKNGYVTRILIFKVRLHFTQSSPDDFYDYTRVNIISLSKRPEVTTLLFALPIGTCV